MENHHFYRSINYKWSFSIAISYVGLPKGNCSYILKPKVHQVLWVNFAIIDPTFQNIPIMGVTIRNYLNHHGIGYLGILALSIILYHIGISGDPTLRISKFCESIFSCFLRIFSLIPIRCGSCGFSNGIRNLDGDLIWLQCRYDGNLGKLANID